MPGDFNHAILLETTHRPWPMPAAPWLMTQTWHDLLFAHWRVDPARLRLRVPAAFPLDHFDGGAWIGIVPFRMTNVAPRGCPALPGLSAFPELNVRTYVRVEDRPGVYFFSLDAASLAAVLGARVLLNLPYFHADMQVDAAGEGTLYRSRRRRGVARFDATYGPVGSPRPPLHGTLEHFLTERYCLYHLSHRGRPYRLEIHHPPWPLQPASAAITRNTMVEAAGISLPDASPLLHFSRRQDMVAWGPQPVRSAPGSDPEAGSHLPL